MRKRLVVLTALLLLVRLATIAAEERADVTPADALWRFDTHG